MQFKIIYYYILIILNKLFKFNKLFKIFQLRNGNNLFKQRIVGCLINKSKRFNKIMQVILKNKNSI